MWVVRWQRWALVASLLTLGCAEVGVQALGDDGGDFFKETPPEPETEGDPDAKVETDAESFVDEIPPLPGEEDGNVAVPDDASLPVEDSGAPTMDAGTETPFDAGTTPTEMDVPTGGTPGIPCTLYSTTFSEALRELDAPAGGSQRLVFTIADVPATMVITAGVLRFDTYDANNPTLEGRIYVNGRGGLDLPAARANENRTVTGVEVDVRPFLQAGTNTIEFGPGPLDRSVYRVGHVSLLLRAQLPMCPGTGLPPEVDAGTDGGTTGRPIERKLTYDQAVYTRRNNWVFRCNARYAYTARGASHSTADCPRLYAPDGTLQGTATFVFTNVIAGNYDIRISSRHSVNRNRMGALFIVNGERRRINQRDNRGGLNLAIDTWGRRRLSGRVTVQLNANRNQGSDSVAAVFLRPAR